MRKCFRNKCTHHLVIPQAWDCITKFIFLCQSYTNSFKFDGPRVRRRDGTKDEDYLNAHLLWGFFPVKKGGTLQSSGSCEHSQRMQDWSIWGQPLSPAQSSTIQPCTLYHAVTLRCPVCTHLWHWNGESLNGMCCKNNIEFWRFSVNKERKYLNNLYIGGIPFLTYWVKQNILLKLLLPSSFYFFRKT